MPITPFLRNQAFNPEEIEIMAAAFNDARVVLGLADRVDAATAIVASRIIELAQHGVRTQIELYQGAIEGFKPYEA